MQFKVSPHCHAESYLTGSTAKNLIKRAKELGRTHFCYTDNGHMSSALKVYGMAKKEGLKFIPGIEFYFKDSQCPIITGSQAARARYFTSTVYARTQEAYQELCKMISGEEFSTVDIREKPQQLWTWAHLEKISQFDTTIVLAGVHCLVAKNYLAGRPDLGEEVFKKVKDLFGDRMFVALLVEPWAKTYSQVVEIIYSDDTRDSVLASDRISTDRARRGIKAIELTENNRHTEVVSRTDGGITFMVNKRIRSAKLHKGFLPLPGGDVTVKVNKFLKALGKKYGVKVMATDYAYYAKKADKIVQTMILEGKDKLAANLHMRSSEEVVEYLRETLKVSDTEIAQILQNNDEWAAGFDNLKLSYEWRLADSGGDPLKQIMDIIKQNGRMKWDNPVYVERLQTELRVIAKNGVYNLSGYFLPIRDVLEWYRSQHLLTGPGRGSAGGSLLNYCLGITHLDPIEYNLPFQRFFSMARIKLRKLPDIDVDLEDRTPLVGKDGHSGYLYGRWGKMAAQVSTRTTVRLKSAIQDTNRYFHGSVQPEILALTKSLPPPPQGISDMQFVFGYTDDDDVRHPGLIEQSEELKKYSIERPEEWAIVSSAMGLTRAFSKHASAFVLADVPISDVLPTRDGNITQYEAKECESAGLIKYDFLVVSQIKDIRICMDYIRKKYGETGDVMKFIHQGEEVFIWNLPQIKEVFESTWSGNTESIFQIATKTMTPAVIEVKPTKVTDIADILGVKRPGPMDATDPTTGRTMDNEWIARVQGLSHPDMPELYNAIPETHGILIYQEQLGKIAMELAGFSAEDAELLRENMAKKKMEELAKMKPLFLKGAAERIDAEAADQIWEQMVTFGRYGFSVIHAVEYALITYACMFLKHFYPLEWWAAVLTNAEQKEITGKFWPHVKDIFSPPDINLSSDEMVVDYANGKIRAKMGVISGMGDKSIEPIVAGRPYKNIQDFVDKKVAGQSLTRKLIFTGVLDSLFPPKTPMLEMMQMYEDAVELRDFQEKWKAKTPEQQMKAKAKGPKKGVVSEEYIEIHPIKEIAMKKAILPSIQLNVYDVARHFSKVLVRDGTYMHVRSPYKGKPTRLVNGEILQRLDEMSCENMAEDKYVAATCYVIKSEVFTYANSTKRALKVIVDADGYVSEKVIWPDHNSGELEYPAELKKGAIATFFFRKRAGQPENRKALNVMAVVMES